MSLSVLGVGRGGNDSDVEGRAGDLLAVKVNGELVLTSNSGNVASVVGTVSVVLNLNGNTVSSTAKLGVNLIATLDELVAKLVLGLNVEGTSLTSNNGLETITSNLNVASITGSGGNDGVEGESLMFSPPRVMSSW